MLFPKGVHFDANHLEAAYETGSPEASDLEPTSRVADDLAASPQHSPEGSREVHHPRENAEETECLE